MSKLKKVLVVFFVIFSATGYWIYKSEDTQLAILYLALPLADGYHNETQYYSKNKFDRELWLAADDSFVSTDYSMQALDNCTRGKMYRDLSDNYLKFFMTREEFEGLLGKTNLIKKNIFRDCNCYELGWCGYGAPKILIFCQIPLTRYFTYKLTNVNEISEIELKQKRVIKWKPKK